MQFNSNTTEITLNSTYLCIGPEEGAKDLPLLTILHGYGKSADEYSILPRRISETDYGFVIPQAPFRFLNEGALGYGWVMTPRGGEDKAGRQLGEKYVLDVTKKAKKQLETDENRQYLMAFSQSAFIATILALKHPHVYSKTILQCGWSNLEVIKPQLERGLEGLEFFVQAGLKDDVVPPEISKQLGETLAKHDANVLYKEYDCPHEYVQPMLTDVHAYLQNQTIENAVKLT